jgi:hypothetical protein
MCYATTKHITDKKIVVPYGTRTYRVPIIASLTYPFINGRYLTSDSFEFPDVQYEDVILERDDLGIYRGWSETLQAWVVEERKWNSSLF